jgi:spore germination protein YaaH
MFFAMGLIFVSILGYVNTALANPKTGDSVDCDSHGGSWTGAPMAVAGHGKCLEARSYAAGSAPDNNAAIAVDSQAAEAAVARQPLGRDWSLRQAKAKYKADEISRVEYEAVRRDLKLKYRAKIKQMKKDYKQGLISKDQYKQQIRDAKYAYEG